MKIGIIGMGGAGRAHHERFRKHKRVTRVLAYDAKPISFPPATMVDELDRMLDQVDAVSICTPDHEHLRDIAHCIERGKHILVEKPMVASLEEADALEERLAAHADQVFAVHHQMRFVPVFQEARTILKSGVLGRLFYAEANYWHDMRERSVAFDDWRMQERGQSVIFAHGCHPYDLLMHLLDAYPLAHTTMVNKNAFTAYPRDYTAATTLFEFPGEITAKVHINNCCVFPQLNDLILLGDQGSFVNGELFTGAGFAPARDRGFPRDRRRVVRDALDYTKRAALRALRRNFIARSLWRTTPLSVYDHPRACQTIVDNFVTAVLDSAPVLVGFADARRAVRLCEEIESSVREKRP